MTQINNFFLSKLRKSRPASTICLWLYALWRPRPLLSAAPNIIHGSLSCQGINHRHVWCLVIVSLSFSVCLCWCFPIWLAALSWCASSHVCESVYEFSLSMSILALPRGVRVYMSVKLIQKIYRICYCTCIQQNEILRGTTKHNNNVYTTFRMTRINNFFLLKLRKSRPTKINNNCQN